MCKYENNQTGVCLVSESLVVVFWRKPSYPGLFQIPEVSLWFLVCSNSVRHLLYTSYIVIWRWTNYAAVVSLQHWNNGNCGSARLSVLPLRLFRLIFLPDSDNPFHIFLRSCESASRFIQCAFEILCGYTWHKQKHTIHRSDSFLPVPVIGLDGVHVCLY